MSGPTWAQFEAWCHRNGVNAPRARDDIERHAADEEAWRWLFTEAQAKLDDATRERIAADAQGKFDAAMKRAIP